MWVALAMFAFVGSSTHVGERVPFFTETFENTLFVGRPLEQQARIRAVATEPVPDGLTPAPPARHLVLTPATGETALFESNVFVPSRPFRDVILSWNVDGPAHCGVRFDLRVARQGETSWSPWLFVGEWGRAFDDTIVLECEQGRVAVDVFMGACALERVQWRVRARAMDERETVVRLRRVAQCVSNRDVQVPGAGATPSSTSARIDVPFRSQKTERAEIAGRICSPTSVSMVLAHHGVDVPVQRVAELAHDSRHDLYGNWPRNVQAAHELGVSGYVTRFQHWSDVEASLARNEPIVASIGVKKGQLAGAPYEATDGHLIVLTGFDERGDVHVNDPAASDAAKGRTTYARAELDVVWLARGGVAYVLTPRLQRTR